MIDYPVLIASSEIENRQILETILVEDGLNTICTSTLKETRDTLAKTPVSVVICDRRLIDGTFKDLLEPISRAHPKVFLVVTSPTGAWEDHIEAKRLGAFEVIPSPCHRPDVEWAVIRALRAWRQEFLFQVAPAVSSAPKITQPLQRTA